ncbi:MAG: reverse transcriptase family protein [Spirosomataceae bacterium]
MNNPTLVHIKRLNAQFEQLQTADDLARLLKTDRHKLQLMATKPAYHTFTVRKPSGGERFIEDPAAPLKKIQRMLNAYMQARSHLSRTSAAYGFMIAVKGDTDPRGIRHNARRHLGAVCMLNMDFDAFFHTVSAEQIFEVFSQKVYSFAEPLAELLTLLCTYQLRLPMGAPTSPVLSNLASIELDQDLLTIAKGRRWRYTRFVDDLTFSGAEPFTLHDVQLIANTASLYGYVVNPDKTRLLGPSADKEVTGIKVGKNRLELTDELMSDIVKDLTRLRTIHETQYQSGCENTKWVLEFEQHVRGQLAFAKEILGENDSTYQDLQQRFEKATDVSNFGQIGWRSLAQYW